MADILVNMFHLWQILLFIFGIYFGKYVSLMVDFIVYFTSYDKFYLIS